MEAIVRLYEVDEVQARCFEGGGLWAVKIVGVKRMSAVTLPSGSLLRRPDHFRPSRGRRHCSKSPILSKERRFMSDHRRRNPISRRQILSPSFRISGSQQLCRGALLQVTDSRHYVNVVCHRSRGGLEQELQRGKSKPWSKRGAFWRLSTDGWRSTTGGSQALGWKIPVAKPVQFPERKEASKSAS